MASFNEKIDSTFLELLKDYNFKYAQSKTKPENGALDILYDDKLSIKVYDKCGHGSGITINLAENYDESMYKNDLCNINWAFRYFQIEQAPIFFGRGETVYQKNLPIVTDNIKLILPHLSRLTLSEWGDLKDWIENASEEIRKKYRSNPSKYFT